MIRFRGITFRRRLEHLSSDGELLELYEKRLCVALRMIQPIRNQLNGRKLPSDLAGDRSRFCVGRRAAKDRHVRFELDRIEGAAELTYRRAKRRPKRLARPQPQSEFSVSDLDIPASTLTWQGDGSRGACNLRAFLRRRPTPIYSAVLSRSQLKFRRNLVESSTEICQSLGPLSRAHRSDYYDKSPIPMGSCR